MILTEHQRDVLKERLAKALCWSEATVYARTEAARLAEVIIDELERSGHTASTQRRAVTNILSRLGEKAG